MPPSPTDSDADDNNPIAPAFGNLKRGSDSDDDSTSSKGEGGGDSVSGSSICNRECSWGGLFCDSAPLYKLRRIGTFHLNGVIPCLLTISRP